jgi:hypothetical protein
MFMILALLNNSLLWIALCFLAAFTAWVIAIYYAVESNIRGGGGFE